MKTTLRNMEHPADICRANGWRVGTILEGDEGKGPERIRVTAIDATTYPEK